MNRELLIGRILEDENIRGDLTDDAAEPLMEWLVQQAEAIIDQCKSETDARKQIDALCQRGRAIARFVTLARENPAEAARVAEAEHLPWPLKVPAADEALVMREVLAVSGEPHH
jgi:thymidine phosphorylase